MVGLERCMLCIVLLEEKKLVRFALVRKRPVEPGFSVGAQRQWLWLNIIFFCQSGGRCSFIGKVVGEGDTGADTDRQLALLWGKSQRGLEGAVISVLSSYLLTAICESHSHTLHCTLRLLPIVSPGPIGSI